MDDAIRLIGLSGSLRAGSFNTAMLRLAAARMPEGATLTIAEIADIPLYHGDVETAGMPAPVLRLREDIRACDGLVIATPEYNHSIPGVLKNVLDWVSRPTADSVTAGKPVAILGAGGRLGTARAQWHLRDVCHGLDLRPIARPELFVVNAWEQLDADGRARDPALLKGLDQLIAGLVQDIRLRMAGATLPTR